MLHLPPKKIPRLFVKTFFGNKPVSDSDSDSDYYITATFSQLVFAVRKKKNYLLSLKYKVCLMFLYNAEGLTDVKMKNLVANRLRVKE